MADSINPRCPECGVRHKRPICQPDDCCGPGEACSRSDCTGTPTVDRPYEVGDQHDTDLAADIAASRRAQRDRRISPAATKEAGRG